jgi:hypothetical protein
LMVHTANPTALSCLPLQLCCSIFFLPFARQHHLFLPLQDSLVSKHHASGESGPRKECGAAISMSCQADSALALPALSDCVRWRASGPPRRWRILRRLWRKAPSRRRWPGCGRPLWSWWKRAWAIGEACSCQCWGLSLYWAQIFCGVRLGLGAEEESVRGGATTLLLVGLAAYAGSRTARGVLS